MSFLNRNRTTTQQQESNIQETTGFENIGGPALNLRDIEGDIDLNVQTTDAGTVQSSFQFASDVSRQANQVAATAVDTLSGAIQKAGDVTRGDTADTLRRLGLPIVIAVGVIFGLRALKGAK